MKNSELKIFDTTLRDGTQGEGIAFSVTDKLRIAERLDQFGVDYIEGGFPGSNPRDIAFFAEVGKLKLHHARIAAFGSTRRAGVTAEHDAQLKALLDANTPVVTIVGKTWLLPKNDIFQGSVRRSVGLPCQRLAALADTHPDYIKNTVADLSDGTYVVRFFKPNGEKTYVPG